MNEFDIELVDNQEFLDFFTEETNPRLSEESRKVLLSSDGASPIDNVDGLREALKAMFDERLSRFLDVIALPGLFFADTSTCSDETRDAN